MSPTPHFRQQAELWWQLARRDIATRHKGSYLGPLWILLGPLLEFSVYLTVFGFIFRGSYQGGAESRLTYALGVFLSLTCYRLLADVLGTAPTLIVSQPNYVKKVVFPLHLLPLAHVASVTYRFLVSLALFLLAYVCVGPGLSVVQLLLPVVLAPLLLLALGCAWLLAALGVFLRDIAQVTGLASLILLYSSAVFYPAAAVVEKSALAWSILRLNPLLHLVESARAVMLWHTPPTPGALLYAWAAGLAGCALGYWTFRKLRPAFADVV
jgi:lipopolysaccharide transport system permease protein